MPDLPERPSLTLSHTMWLLRTQPRHPGSILKGSLRPLEAFPRQGTERRHGDMSVSTCWGSVRTLIAQNPRQARIHESSALCSDPGSSMLCILTAFVGTP